MKAYNPLIILLSCVACLFFTTASAQPPQKGDAEARRAERNGSAEKWRTLVANLRADAFTNIAAAIEQRSKDLHATSESASPGLGESITFENQTAAAEGKDVFDRAAANDLSLLGGIAKVALWKCFDTTAAPMRHHTGKPDLIEGAYSEQVLVGTSRSIMIFGPYQPFDPGRYIVVYRFQFLADVAGNSACFLDVSYKAVTYSGRRPGTNAAPARVWNQMAVPLGVPQSMEFEFRFWPHGNLVALDRIYVYRLTDRPESSPLRPVAVMGAVVRPGFYILQNGSASVRGICKIAGGYDRLAYPGQCMVWRQKGESMETVAFEDEYAREYSEIVPGDILWIPERNYPQLLRDR